MVPGMASDGATKVCLLARRIICKRNRTFFIQKNNVHHENEAGVTNLFTVEFDIYTFIIMTCI